MTDDYVTVLGKGRFLELVSSNGWEFVRRRNARGVVAIAALTANHELLLVEQFRPALGRACIEIPAGLAGDETQFEGESLEDAARRELEEETGYRAKSLTRVFEGPSSAGLTNEAITFFLAAECARVSSSLGSGNESIALHVVPAGHLREWLQQKIDQGLGIDPKLLTAVTLLHWHGLFPLTAPN